MVLDDRKTGKEGESRRGRGLAEAEPLGDGAGSGEQVSGSFWQL